MKRVISVMMIILVLSVQTISITPVLAEDTYNYTDVFAKSILFYEANWCGEKGEDNRLAWRDDCHLEDGSDVDIDLTGGFHDAGDHVKFGLPQGYSASTLGWAYYEFKDTFIEKGQDGYMLNILKHFTDYFLKCYPNNTTFYYQNGDGTTDHSYWGPPELQKTSRPTLFTATPDEPASDVCGDAAAALALMYMNYKDIDLDYAEECLTAAKNLFEFAKTYKGLSQSGGFYSSTSYWDELSWAGIWLYIATKDDSYMTDVVSFLESKGISGDNVYANHWTHCWDDVWGGVFVKLSQITDNTTYKEIAEENLDYWMNDAPSTPAGLKYINSWGALRYTAAECMMALVYYKTSQNTEYLDFAKEQIDYMLGSNPRNSSYVVGFGNNYPKFPHHRAASGRLEGAPAYESKNDSEKHLLYGALVGGPDIDDNYSDDVDEYVYTEVAIDYNAGFVGAMAGMAKYFGEDMMPEDTPGIEPDTPEYFVEAKVMEENNQKVTIQAFIHNDSLLPPKYETELSFRYFFDLTEYYEQGISASEILPQINYAPNNGAISDLIPWDEENHIYYVEASWPDTELYGKTEFQFSLTAYNYTYWDSSNDYSQTGLTDTIATTEYIPVYRAGEIIFGNEPAGSINSSISPTTASFDKNESEQTDIAVTVDFNENTLDSIINETDELILGTDYTLSDNTVTILKSYLAEQSVGTINLTFDFSEGEDRILAVTIVDTTPGINSSISPVTAIFDKDNQSDVDVTMTLNGNTLDAITNGSTTLVNGTDYTISEDIVTIKKGYLADLSLGKVSFTFDFSEGADCILTVTIMDSSIDTSIELKCYNSNTTLQTNTISPKFYIKNAGDMAIDLTTVKIRYYYTIDTEKSQSFWCDWSTVGSENITGTFVEMDTTTDGADYYLEVGFLSGAESLAADQGIEIHTRAAKSDWSNYNQEGDYSFNSDATTYVEWDKVTMYISDNLMYGIEP